MKPLPFKYNDGGRAAAGYKGQASDCVCRAIAIATGMQYEAVYRVINSLGSSPSALRGLEAFNAVR